MASDWWITELDAEAGYAFGYVRLSAMPEFAEWGSIDLAELEALTVTLRTTMHTAEGLRPGQPLTVVAVERGAALDAGEVPRRHHRAA